MASEKRDLQSANAVAVLKKQDEERVAFMMGALEKEGGMMLPMHILRDRFFKMVSMPLQSHCKESKTFGGKWLSRCGSIDGDKVVCMDHLRILEQRPCLVYSFGISKDWNFEEAMVSLGCSVRAFDPSIHGPYRPKPNITFHKVGLGHFTGNASIRVKKREVTVPVKTLGDLRREFGEADSIIHYLKVDIEGSELLALPEWIDSGALGKVRQIGMELHLSPVVVPDEGSEKTYFSLIKSFQQMYEMGFRLVSYTPNGCMGRKKDLQRRYYRYVEVVFYRP